MLCKVKEETEKNSLEKFSHILYIAAKSLQLCLTLCDPRDSSPPGSPVPGIIQARTLEWVAISFSNAWKWKVKVKLLSRVQLFATPWTAAYQAPLSMGFSRQEYWSGVPLPSLFTLCTLQRKKSLQWGVKTPHTTSEPHIQSQAQIELHRQYVCKDGKMLIWNGPHTLSPTPT